MKVIKAPNKLEWDEPISIFLAGSIEMGTAELWQDRMAAELTDYDCVILNPRRDNWDVSLKQSINEAKFKEQVLWELEGLDQADIVVFYLDPNTKSPITLMELGLCAKSHAVIVCCPDGFWRKGNVEVICDLFEIPLVNTFDELVVALRKSDLADYKLT